jgi:hypothetical protein
MSSGSKNQELRREHALIMRLTSKVLVETIKKESEQIFVPILWRAVPGVAILDTRHARTKGHSG